MSDSPSHSVPPALFWFLVSAGVIGGGGALLWWVWREEVLVLRMNSRRVLRAARHLLRHHIRRRMDLMLESYLNPTSEGDFPPVESPIWIFGRSHSVTYDLEELRRRVSSCVWVSYRKGFDPLGDSGLTSDKGWGCMIRTGQMLLAKALLNTHLGPEWDWKAETMDPSYLKIISLFRDSFAAPFSLHNVATVGGALGKPVGSWLGPNTVCQALNRLLTSGSTSLDLGMHIAMDSTLVLSDVRREAMTYPEIPLGASPTLPVSNILSTPRRDPKWRPTLLILPLRLGLSELNPAYISGLKAVLEMPQSLGIIGGRPNHALYFIGYAENEVLFLDPHTVQPAVTIGHKLREEQKEGDLSYHCGKPGRLAFSSMDPSLALAFLCVTEADFKALVAGLKDRFSSPASLPLFELTERRAAPDLYFDPSATTDGTFTSIGACSSTSSRAKNPSYSDLDDDEFEILG